MKHNALRVLHAPGGSAGQPACIAKAQNKLGLLAHSMRIGDNKFQYPADIILPANESNSYCEALVNYAEDYDVFHFYFRPFFYNNKYCTYPMGMDILTLRALGKVVVLHFRGSEIRLHSVFEKSSPYNYVSENPYDIVSKFPEKEQKSYLQLMKSVCNQVMVTDPELLTYCPEALIVPRAIDLSNWQYVGVSESDQPPLIVHAPSRRIVKGTDILVNALDRLRAEGVKFRIKFVENMPHAEVKEIYSKADVIVDQLRIGWYGVLSVEAMALGKPVLVYIRQDLQKHLIPDSPLVMTNPENLAHDLKKIIMDISYRKKVSHLARSYVEKVHNCKNIALQLIDIYNDCIKRPKKIDLNSLKYTINSFGYYNNPNIIHSFMKENKYKNVIYASLKYYKYNGLLETLKKIKTKVRNLNSI